MKQAYEARSTGPADTKNRILDAAECLFAQHGLQAASLRQITSAAGVNLAAVNYHFRTKDALFQAVLRRRIDPINRLRLEMLEAAEKSAEGGALPLEGVVEAFLAPMFTNPELTGPIAQFIGRLYTEPGAKWKQIVYPVFREVVDRFRPALLRALPGCEAKVAALGVHFAIGSAAHFLAAGHMVEVIAGTEVRVEDRGWALRNLVRYVVAGLRGMTQGEARR